MSLYPDAPTVLYKFRLQMTISITLTNSFASLINTANASIKNWTPALFSLLASDYLD